MNVDSSALAELIVQVVYERFTDHSFGRRQLMDAVEKELRIRRLTILEDKRSSTVIELESKDRAEISKHISELISGGHLVDERGTLRLNRNALVKVRKEIAIRKTTALFSEFMKSRGVSLEVIDGILTDSSQVVRISNENEPGATARLLFCWPSIANAKNCAAKLFEAPFQEGHIELNQRIVDEQAKGIDHYLLIQRDESAITSAILIPIAQVPIIWAKQAEISPEHAKTGTGCTLWLFDSGEPALADALWSVSGVRNLLVDTSTNLDDVEDDNNILHQKRQGTDTPPPVHPYMRASNHQVECTPEHARMQRELMQQLRTEYPQAIILRENDFIDVSVTTADSLFLFEIKSDLEPRSVIRQALGQILEYAFHPARIHPLPVQLVIVGQRAPSTADEEYLKLLKTRFGLPISYRTLGRGNSSND